MSKTKQENTEPGYHSEADNITFFLIQKASEMIGSISHDSSNIVVVEQNILMAFFSIF